MEREEDENELKRRKTSTSDLEQEEEEEEEEEEDSSENDLMFEADDVLCVDSSISADFVDSWDGSHLRRPCSSKNLYRRQDETQALSKWVLIVESISLAFGSVSALEKAVNKYQVVPLHMHGLRCVLRDENDRREFFLHTLPRIQRLVLRTPSILQAPIPLLLSEGRVELSRRQCACIVANMFLCTFPRQGGKTSEMGTMDFSRLFASTSASNVAKLQCVLSYFSTDRESDDVVVFSRVSAEARDLHFFQSCDNLVSKDLEVVSSGKIEDSSLNDRDWCEVDFANKQLGGGVLGNGAIQEEIRFAMAPELLVCRVLYCALGDSEAAYFQNSLICSRVEGYSDSFRFASTLSPGIPASIVAIDALQFSSSGRSLQWKEEPFVREANKCLIGFGCVAEEGLATGNWGAGFFNGDPELKSIIQLLCSSILKKRLRYYTFGQLERLEQVHAKLVELKATVGSVVSLILNHDPSASLFEEILNLN